MKRRNLFINALRLIVRLIASFDPLLPRIIERDVKHTQGKGIGFNSCEIEAKHALQFLLELGVRNPLVFDVGANVGLFSKAILERSPLSRIVAFEPSALARSELRAMFSNDDRVTISPFALGNEIGSSTLWSNVEGSGLGSLTRRELQHFGIAFDNSEQVEVTTLDAWNENQQLSPDFIKIDVEGHELDVLKGATKTIETVKVIQFEFGGCNIDTRTFYRDFWNFFRDSGFELYRISKKGPLRIANYDEEDEYFVTTNYLAVRGSTKND
jgi:FkbM family methyltransferase